MIPNFNGARWLPGVLRERRGADRRAGRGRRRRRRLDGRVARAARGALPARPGVARPANGGFARAANDGIGATTRGGRGAASTPTSCSTRDWLEHATARARRRHPGAASVATKMVDLADPTLLYDAGDVLRRDGVCEQRGRFERDTGAYDEPGEIFAACAGAALYRRARGRCRRRLRRAPRHVPRGRRPRAAAAARGLDLPLGAARRRRARGGGIERRRPGPGWSATRCCSSPARSRALAAARRLPPGRAGRGTRRVPATLRTHLAGVRAALPLLPAFARERRAVRARAAVPVERVVPARPIRGPAAGGHPSRHAR